MSTQSAKSSTPRLFLVTAAVGSTGRPTIAHLLAAGHRVRAFVRKEDDRSEQLRKQGAEIVTGDLLDFNAVRAALEGVSGAYFCYPIAPGIITATAYFAQAAKEAGVKSIVNMSQISARRDSASHAAQDHWTAERVFDWAAATAGAASVTHIRPTFFAEWLIYSDFGVAGSVKAGSGVIRLPLGQGKHAPIAAEDQGRFIAAVLQDPTPHASKIYPLCGPKQSDHHGIAAAIGEALGRKITYEAMPVEVFRGHLSSVPPFLVQHLIEVVQDYSERGIFEGEDEIITKVTGKAPMTVQEFVQRNRKEFEQ